MKALVYEHRKKEGQIYDISTPEKEVYAYRRLFLELDHYWNVYAEIEEMDDVPAPEETQICEACDKNFHKGCEGSSESPCTCKEKVCANKNGHFLLYQRKMRKWYGLYTRAKAGDGLAAMQLIKERSKEQFEYEEVREIEISDPEREFKIYLAKVMSKEDEKKKKA